MTARTLATLFILALACSALPALASGVERGSMPAEMRAIAGIPQDIQKRAEETIRDRCNLDGIFRVHAQNFRSSLNVTSPELGRFDRYVIEYTAYYSEIPQVRQIVVDALLLRDSGEILINAPSSSICK